MLLWSQRDISLHFQELKLQHGPVHLKTFEEVAKCRLWRFSKFHGVE